MKTKILSLLKSISAIILLSCFFLPLSRCQIKTPEDTAWHLKNQPEQQSLSKLEENRSQSEKTIKHAYSVPYKFFNMKDFESWLILIPFFFTVPFIIFERKITKFWKIILTKLFEALAALFSTYLIYVLSHLGKPLLAGYIALSSVSIYLLVVMIQFTTIIIDRIRRKGPSTVLKQGIY